MLGMPKSQFNCDFDSLALSNLISEPGKIQLGKPGQGSLYAEILEPGAKAIGKTKEEAGLLRGENQGLRSRLMTTIISEHLDYQGIPWKAEYEGTDIVGFVPGILEFIRNTKTCHHYRLQGMEHHYRRQESFMHQV
jgi:hypothetical protein